MVNFAPPWFLLWTDPSDIRAGLMAKSFLKDRITKGQYPALKNSKVLNDITHDSHSDPNVSY